MASKREIFAKNFRSALEKSHLGITKLADICSVSKGTAGDWLSGRTMPRADKISMIAKALGVTEQELLNDFESRDERRNDTRGVMDIAQELLNDLESRKLYEGITKLSPENKQALAQIVRTMNLSQKN